MVGGDRSPARSARIDWCVHSVPGLPVQLSRLVRSALWQRDGLK